MAAVNDTCRRTDIEAWAKKRGRTLHPLDD
jgi:hypothetical protein